MEGKVNIAIIHYNTPLLTECLVKSINKFTPNSNIYIFDNSDKEPFTYRQDNITYFDNTKGEILNFDEWLENFPNRIKSGEATKSFGSAKHSISIQKCLELIDDNFILLDSDILLKKDISELFDDSFIYIAETMQQPLCDIHRVLPYVCFINVKMMKKNGIQYFNENYMHGLYLSLKGDMYDTGGWFYLACKDLPSKEICYEDYIYHYKGGSWNETNNKRIGKKRSIYDWIALHEDCFIETYEQYKNDLEAMGKKHGIPIDLEEPKTIQDKINWLKLYDSTLLKTWCADKIRLHDYCKDKIGEDICVPILGVYDSPNEIEWDKLPESFVLKCNHGSGMNIIVEDKSNFDREQAIVKLTKWFNTDFAFQNGYEMHYHNIERKVFVEEYIGDTSKEFLTDYKFLCFNGVPKYCMVISDRGEKNQRLNYYDMDFNFVDICKAFFESNPDMIDKKPKNFERMKKIAEVLSSNFKFVRVDFYEEKGKIYLGEMTFTPVSGFFRYKRVSDAEKIGNLLNLKNKKVIYTCITGNYEPLDDPFVISPGFDYICFTNSPSIKSDVWKLRPIPEELDGLTEVKKQRCIKINPHKYLPEYELSIWVDGCVKLLKDVNGFVEKNCSDGNVFIPEHPQRKCLYEEMDACIKLKKDIAANIEPQRMRYISEKFPRRYGLVQSNIIVRRHNKPDCIRLMEKWWDEVKNGSHRDQLSFDYARWKNKNVKVVFLDKNTCRSEYFRWDSSHGKRKTQTPKSKKKFDMIKVLGYEPVHKKEEPKRIASSEIAKQNPTIRRRMVSNSLKTFLKP